MKAYADGKIQVQQQGPVTTVIINRPEVRNALDNDAARGLGRAMRDFDADDSQAVAVLSGAGGAFCAGADLKQVAGSSDYVAWAGDPDGPTNPTLSKPVIAAVEGHAVAGGLGIALWCDIRIVDETTVFGVFCRRWGVPMSDGTTVRLPRLIGAARALDMLITGRGVNADEAIDWGLATRRAAKGQTRQVAEELALQIAGFPQIAMRSDRMSAYKQAGQTMEDAVRTEKELSQEAKAIEASEGAARFATGAGRHGEFSE
ncbi:MAG: crotonase/enoyl-CoA hydratase family protein [Rhodospirillaceae bacterium]|jgi:enoyl-CoA hydratase|nr:crotonase/enoyl-CoA hydratase family protein [Rhodospirillaceae bacterium]MBT5082788.1 crotonase/enoyl-CoA hydratase family protein [Rhodospirillaceae bacterium]MBT5524994.1 crotonase/enoyl-CoA hydratase family protein [Rhodospirillaceae bacterium]MBT5881017.1 crotonase/enoyl-CoA hydratase family protein [Rhodospirillaceae bacterium]MBT6592196.1 crotonase/enoyl-CoA hydratase family protein [Rhodospirillaceae bacterium]